MYAPIALFVYNRLDHTRQTANALAANELAVDSDLWVFSDGAKNENDQPQVSDVRQYVESLGSQGLFRSVTVVESEQNKGLADSIIQGVTAVLSKAECVIVLEDDLVTAPDFLSFMNDCLLYYRDKPVGAISGYSPVENLPCDYHGDVYVSKRSCSHGWATWRDRWQEVDWEVPQFDQFRKNAMLRREFDSTGADRFDRLRRQVEGDIDSWSVRFGFHLFMQDLTVLYPVTNRVSNIGFDGSGVHTKSYHQNGLATKISDHPVTYNLSYPSEDSRITRMFFDLYSGTRIRTIARGLRNSNAVVAVRHAARKLSRVVAGMEK